MVSDSSRLSRSSSISSASSVSAPSAKLDVLARCRSAKNCGERSSLKRTFAPVPEDWQAECLVASPESYTGPVSDSYARAHREQEMREAALTLQELQTHGAGKQPPIPARAGSKRRHGALTENSLQENVRELLSGGYPSSEPAWSDSFVRSRPAFQQVPVRTALGGYNKRLCFSSSEEDEAYLMPSFQHSVGGPGMWAGILN